MTSLSPAAHGRWPAELGGDERLARAALTALRPPGDPAVYELIRDHGPVSAYQQLAAGEDAAIAVDRVHRALDAVHEGVLRLVIPGDAEWPPALTTLTVAGHGAPAGSWAPPPGLWIRGTLPLTAALSNAVAVVGSSAATAYGERIAADLAAGCAAHGWTVLSGSGFGCESAAQRAALATGAGTIAVLASGVDRPHPAARIDLFEQIAGNGLLISETAPGIAASRLRYAARARLIAALARGVVLVEAAAHSGALATAKIAAELGKPAMAVPGPVTSAMSAGCHELLRSGTARLVTCTADVLAEIISA